jgi:hypothetical protein
LGDLGWKWVYIGGQGREAGIAVIAGIAKIAEIERKDLKGNWGKSERQERSGKGPEMCEIGMATQELGRGP